LDFISKTFFIDLKDFLNLLGVKVGKVINKVVKSGKKWEIIYIFEPGNKTCL